MAKKKQDLTDFTPAIEESIVTPQQAYNTHDLRVLQGLPPIEHLEPATVVAS